MEKSCKLERRASELLEGCVPPQAWHSGVNDANLIVHVPPCFWPCCLRLKELIRDKTIMCFKVKSKSNDNPFPQHIQLFHDGIQETARWYNPPSHNSWRSRKHITLQSTSSEIQAVPRCPPLYPRRNPPLLNLSHVLPSGDSIICLRSRYRNIRSNAIREQRTFQLWPRSSLHSRWNQRARSLDYGLQGKEKEGSRTHGTTTC